MAVMRGGREGEKEEAEEDERSWRGGTIDHRCGNHVILADHENQEKKAREREGGP